MRNELLTSLYARLDFQVSAFDLCLYIEIIEEQCVLLLVYVDNVLVAENLTEVIVRTACEQ